MREPVFAFSVMFGFFSVFSCTSGKGGACAPGTDLPLSVRLAMVAVQAGSDAQARERIEFQVDFLRTLKGGRLHEAFYGFALAGVEPRCAAGAPDPAFLECFQGVELQHLKLLERTWTPTDPQTTAACPPVLENCQDLRARMTDQHGRDLHIDAGAVCRYRGRYWVFGRLACERRQSDSNR